MSGQDDANLVAKLESNARYLADMAERYFVRMEQAAQKLRSLTRYKLERHGGDDGGGDLVEDSDGHWLDADEVGWVIRDLEATNDTA
jgi:hypothetical protein